MSDQEKKKKAAASNLTTPNRLQVPQTHGKLFRKVSLTEKIPSPIYEVTVEDDNSSNEEVPSTNSETPVSTINYERETVEKGRKKHSIRSVDSRASNSNISESGHNGQQNEENGFARNNGIANSIRSSTRCSSVQSLSVIREQYCCFAKWTPCERILGATVGIMAIIIVICLVVIGILSSNTGSNFEGLALSL